MNSGLPQGVRAAAGTPALEGARYRHWLGQLLGPKVAPYIFISPFFLMFAVFWVFPVVWSVLLSFQRWSFQDTTWVATDNYRFVLSSPAVRVAFRNTVWYVVANNVFQLSIALSVAVLLDLPFLRGMSGWLRAAYFMPNIVSGVTTAILFGIVLGTGGVLNSILPQIQWLQSTEWSKPAVLMAGGWRWIGYWVVMFMAGLQSIPDDYYEAADLDGATLWQRFSMITFPCLRPVFLFVIVVNTMGTLQIFEEPYMLFGTGLRGGPLNSATTPVLEMYKLGFQNFDLGSASALGWLLAILIIAVSIAQFSLARRGGWSE
ncbi:MAG: carbohydrate ABC transporter permease [Anaerolineae bacterium]